MKQKIDVVDLFLFVVKSGLGGAQRVTVEIFNNLPEYISTQLITTYATKDTYNLRKPAITLCPYENNILKVVYLPLSILKYINLVKRYKPKVIISALSFENIINIIVGKILGTQSIISVHNMQSYKFGFQDSILQKILFILAKCNHTKIIAVSNGVKNELINLRGITEENIIVIYNPVDINSISKLSQERVNDDIFKEDVLSIITVGRLNNVKGQWHLLRVFAELRHLFPCQLVFCGDGPEKEYLQSLARELDISKDVVFLGWCNNPYKYISKSTVFVLSSLTEAMPNVLIESLACGCPVVATDCSPGIEEILGSEDEYGLISKKMSGIRYGANETLDEGEQDLMRQILRVVNDSKFQEQLSCNGKNRAQHFSLQKVILEYVNLIEKYNYYR